MLRMHRHGTPAFASSSSRKFQRPGQQYFASSRTGFSLFVFHLKKMKTKQAEACSTCLPFLNHRLTAFSAGHRRVVQPLTFRVAAPSRFFEGAEGRFFVSNEFVSHETQEKSRPRPFQPERVGHPENLNQSFIVDILQWYCPIAFIRLSKMPERVCHPPVEARRNVAGFWLLPH